MSAERYWEGRWRDEKAENERLIAALKIARQWMPVQPIEEKAKYEVAIVDATLELHEGASSTHDE